MYREVYNDTAPIPFFKMKAWRHRRQNLGLQFTEWEAMLLGASMKRFIPYYKHLNKVKWQFIVAIVAGVLFGAASGAGLPWMMKTVLPEVFSKDDIPFLELLGVAMIMPAVFFVHQHLLYHLLWKQGIGVPSDRFVQAFAGATA
jgi:hypothetical protein